jgi:uncharacterized phage-associated protein
MYSALDLAKYFIKLASPEEEDFMTNLKLQKLLYYAQGFHLALYEKPLFSEQIEAWQYGPVVPEVYHLYKPFKSNALPHPDDFNLDHYDPETRELLDEVYDVYGQYTAPTLARLTHQEKPWKTTPLKQEITHSLMESYFKTQLAE